MSQQTFASTLLLSTGEESNLVRGNRRRKVKQREHMHTTDPSKFWLMSHGRTEERRIMNLKSADKDNIHKAKTEREKIAFNYRRGRVALPEDSLSLGSGLVPNEAKPRASSAPTRAPQSLTRWASQSLARYITNRDAGTTHERLNLSGEAASREDFRVPLMARRPYLAAASQTPYATDS